MPVATTPEDDCPASWCADDDWCAITCSMEVLGRKWHPVIVHRLLEDGPLRFSELADALGPITNKVLADGLEYLQRHRVVDRTVVADRPVAVEYGLTDRGRALRPVIDELEAWGETHLRPDASPT